MSEKHEFPNLAAAGAEFGSRRDLSLAELRSLLCADCDFFHEGHEDDLECSCFQILREIIVRGALTPAGLAEALKKE
ncbi:MAG: hypothetical protein ACYC6Z_05385 [Thermoleophilia bacterium]